MYWARDVRYSNFRFDTDINIQGAWFRIQYQYQYWRNACFDIDINIDIWRRSISKSIPISICKKCLFRTNIEINIDIFDIETDILLHKDPKKGHQGPKSTIYFAILRPIILFFTNSISISISIFQQSLFRNQYRYRYFHDGNSNSIPISISIFSKIFDINTNIHFEPISIAHPWRCQGWCHPISSKTRWNVIIFKIDGFN